MSLCGGESKEGARNFAVILGALAGNGFEGRFKIASSSRNLYLLYQFLFLHGSIA